MPCQPIELPGTHTDRSLIEVLGVSEDGAASISAQLREDFERIREAERAAWKKAAF